MIKKLLLLLSLGVVLWSCTDNDDDYYYDMIVGRWEFRQASPFIVAADPIDIIPSIERDVSNSWYGDWEFFSDGVAIEYANGVSTKYGYFFDSDFLVITDFYNGVELFDVRVAVANRELSMFHDKTYDFRNFYPRYYIEEVIVEAYYRRR